MAVAASSSSKPGTSRALASMPSVSVQKANVYEISGTGHELQWAKTFFATSSSGTLWHSGTRTACRTAGIPCFSSASPSWSGQRLAGCVLASRPHWTDCKSELGPTRLHASERPWKCDQVEWKGAGLLDALSYSLKGMQKILAREGVEPPRAVAIRALLASLPGRSSGGGHRGHSDVRRGTRRSARTPQRSCDQGTPAR